MNRQCKTSTSYHNNQAKQMQFSNSRRIKRNKSHIRITKVASKEKYEPDEHIRSSYMQTTFFSLFHLCLTFVCRTDMMLYGIFESYLVFFFPSFLFLFAAEHRAHIPSSIYSVNRSLFNIFFSETEGWKRGTLTITAQSRYIVTI